MSDKNKMSLSEPQRLTLKLKEGGFAVIPADVIRTVAELPENPEIGTVVALVSDDESKVNGFYVAVEKDGENTIWQLYLSAQSSGDVVTEIPDGSVTTDKIKDKAITWDKMADDAVRSKAIADGAIENRHLNDNSVTKEILASDSVGDDHIQEGAVLEKHIFKDAVTTDKVKDKTITPEKLDREYATPEDVTKAIEGIEFPENNTTVEVPTKLSDLEDDETHRTVTDSEKNTWNKKSDFSGNYSDLNGLPEIPSIEGLATKEYVDKNIKKSLDFQEIELPDNFEGYTDVIHLSESLPKDWSKVKIWSADDGLIIPESRNPYDFDYSLIPETNYAEIGNLPSSLDLKVLPEESMGGSIVLVDENKPAFVMINFVKGDNLRQPLTITAKFLDFTLAYLSVGESISYIDFTATEEGWYVYKGDGSVFAATEKDLSVFSGTYKNLKILDWGSFNVDMMKELGVTILGTEYLLKLFVKDLISFTYPPGCYSAKTPTAKKPVKGVDYFTKEDKSEFVDSVLAALPMWEGGSY